jgi:glycosyltransferase involved in cell wall biosynthesis
VISVIIPTYNRPDLISRSVKSVLNQTVADLEVIVIDGSDTNETARTISIFNDTRIKYFKISNLSAAHSRNIGIQKAKGDFVAFNDDDDVWCDCKIEKQLELFSRNPSDRVVYTTFVKASGGVLRRTPDRTVLKRRGNIYDVILQRNFVGLQTLMLPLLCCQDVMFDENLQCLEDWDWTIRLAKKYPFEFIEESLVTADDTPKSLNKSNYSIKAVCYKRIYEKHYLDISLVSTREAKHLLSIGSNLCLSGELQAGRKYLLRSLKIDPKNRKILGCYLLSFFGIETYRAGFQIFERLTHSQP